MISEDQKNIIIETLMPFNPKMIGIFGSYARDENKKESDMDILVEFRKVVNLLEIVGIEIKLSELLKIKVDIVTRNSIPPRLNNHINKDLQPIFHEEG